MADNKQYVLQNQENGTLMISEDVIATIVEQAVNEVEGIVGLNVKPVSDVADIIGKKAWGKGMKITIAEDSSLSVDCNVNISYGQSVVNVAKAVQDVVTAALESTSGVRVTAVNINVCGIIRQ